MPGDTYSCLYAARLILTGGGEFSPHDEQVGPTAATLVTKGELQPGENGNHCFILWDWILPMTIVPSGFSSGYGGTGPTGLALVLLMLAARDIPIYELSVDSGIFKRLDENWLSA